MNNIYEYLNNIIFSFQAMSGLIAIGGAGISARWHKNIGNSDKSRRAWLPLAFFLAVFCSATSIALGKWGFLSLPCIILIYSYLHFSNKIKTWKRKHFIYFIILLITWSVVLFLILGTAMFKLAVDY